MRIRKVSMSDVADAAGVSMASVDRVLNRRGGVAVDKENRILSAARRLGLDRALTQRPSRTLRVAVLMQPPKNPFHAALKSGIDLAARLHADLNLQFLIHHIDPNRPAAIATLLRERGARHDGLIVTLPEDARIAAALRDLSARRPVLTLATDIALSGRAAYIGPDDRAAGRVAGDLMGRFLSPQGGGVVMIAGLLGLSGHRAREAGFREVLAERHPQSRVGAVLESGEDAVRAGQLVLEALAADPAVRGLYHASAGALNVVQAVRHLGRAENTVIITHELTADRRALLRARAIDAVIDQDPEREAQLAVETMARLLGRLDGAPTSTITAIRIFTPENA